jgi:HlyD family secretion protein
MPSVRRKFLEDFNMKTFRLLFIPAIMMLLVSCSGDNLPPSGSGLIEATEVIISSEVTGRLINLNFSEGDEIHTGDIIGLIDTTTIALRLNDAAALIRAAETKVQSASLAIEQAEYNHGLAKKEFDRVDALVKSGSANRQQYDQLETALQQAALAKKQAGAARDAAEADLLRARAGYDIMKKQLSDCMPISPLAGTIVDKFVEAGELITTGKQLIKVARLDTVWVKIYLPPSDLTRIKLGGTAKVDTEDGQTAVINGTVSWISDAAEFTPKNVQTKESRADLVYAVKVSIPNSEMRLKIGMPVAVEIQ